MARRIGSASPFLDPAQLIEFTRLYASEVAGGKYPYVRYDEDERWHQRIYRDGRLDIWLISWMSEQGTQLHDHGGSCGSFTVISGALTEAVATRAPARHGEWAAGRRSSVVDRVRSAGDSVGFGRRYIHDVRNLGGDPAVSVHAYSPPLTTMNFFDIDGGELVPIRTLVTDDPEPALDIRDAS
jgi:hypothetical protein